MRFRGRYSFGGTTFQCFGVLGLPDQAATSRDTSDFSEESQTRTTEMALLVGLVASEAPSSADLTPVIGATVRGRIQLGRSPERICDVTKTLRCGPDDSDPATSRCETWQGQENARSLSTARYFGTDVRPLATEVRPHEARPIFYSC